MSKIKMILISFLAINALSLTTFAGQNGNGGGGFICPDPKQSEFLDLYEARRPTDHRPALHIPSSEAPVEDQIQAAFAKLKVNPLLYEAVLDTYNSVKTAKIKPLPEGVQLAWPSDALNVYIKAGCQAVGIMIFYDDDLAMDQDSKSLQSLPHTDQAAAWVHETIYRFLRLTRYDVNSIRTRAIVGYLFSDESGDQLANALKDLGLILLTAQDHPGFDAKMSYFLEPSTVNDLFIDLTIRFKITNIVQNGKCYPPSRTTGKYHIQNDDIFGFYLFIPSSGVGMYELGTFFKEITPKWASNGYLCRFDVSFTDQYGNTIQMPNDNMPRFINIIYPGAW
jgi:hypothetical protein